MPKAASKLAAAPSLPPTSIWKTPVVVRNAAITTISLPIESTEATLTVLDYGGTKKIAAEAFLIDKCLQTTDFRSWTIRFKSEVSVILRNNPEPRCYGLVKLRMLKVLTISLPQHQK